MDPRCVTHQPSLIKAHPPAPNSPERRPTQNFSEPCYLKVRKWYDLNQNLGSARLSNLHHVTIDTLPRHISLSYLLPPQVYCQPTAYLFPLSLPIIRTKPRSQRCPSLTHCSQPRHLSCDPITPPPAYSHIPHQHKNAPSTIGLTTTQVAFLFIDLP